MPQFEESETLFFGFLVIFYAGIVRFLVVKCVPLAKITLLSMENRKKFQLFFPTPSTMWFAIFKIHSRQV